MKQQKLHSRKQFEHIRLLLKLAALFAVSLCVILVPSARAQSSKHAQAKMLYAQAQQIRQTLEAEPRDNRTLADYKNIVAAYRKIYLLTPSAPETTEALFAVGQLYHDMGDLFDSIYYKSSLVTYKFLLAQYPTNKYRADALFDIGEIEKDDLHELPEAKNAFTQYVTRFPRTPQADDARKELQDIADEADKIAEDAELPQAKPASEQEQSQSAAGAATDSNGDATLSAAWKPGQAASVNDIRTWNANDYSRVVVDLNGAVKYESARIKNPDRIYFDLYKAQLGSSVNGKELPAQNGFLKNIRVAQNKSGVVRLVLDVQSVEDYSAFLLPNPYRLVIDVHGVDTESASNKPPAGQVPGKLAGDQPSPPQSQKAEAPNDTNPPSGVTTTDTSTSALARRPLYARNIPVGPAVPAKPTRNGETSLTRALGLKISRIVIDPGHGGHDTGTIGPHGLLEKNVCLDVALRLGRLIKEKLPGAKVFYTRKTDVFVPLEERTAIANQDKADLFISIHANSSHDHAARGVETYYLNLTNSADSLEVASRENALSDSSIHQLQDLIKQIARNDKVEESQELATDVQNSLTHQLRLISTAERNRGVKKAPFVVLIGADMPSVLAEIAFLSNPSDEKLLRKPIERQKIAQGIFRGVETYLSSLNSLNYNRQKYMTERQSTATPATRNQN
jgi:N-acetylmuramoyl-L-alanine amidase